MITATEVISAHSSSVENQIEFNELLSEFHRLSLPSRPSAPTAHWQS